MAAVSLWHSARTLCKRYRGTRRKPLNATLKIQDFPPSTSNKRQRQAELIANKKALGLTATSRYRSTKFQEYLERLKDEDPFRYRQIIAAERAYEPVHRERLDFEQRNVIDDQMEGWSAGCNDWTDDVRAARVAAYPRRRPPGLPYEDFRELDEEARRGLQKRG